LQTQFGKSAKVFGNKMGALGAFTPVNGILTLDLFPKGFLPFTQVKARKFSETKWVLWALLLQ